MKMTPALALWLVLLSLTIFDRQPNLVWAESGAELAAKTHERNESFAAWRDPLSRTIVRFFESQSHYYPGDLIVRSQVAELQDYLRKTRGAGPWTNFQLRRRVLVDHACLARIFYGLGGDRLLREAAQKLGGYGPLDRLCQSKSGREILVAAVRQSNFEMLRDYLQKHGLPPEPVRISPADSNKKHPVRKLAKIYTVEGLLKWMQSVSKS